MAVVFNDTKFLSYSFYCETCDLADLPDAETAGRPDLCSFLANQMVDKGILDDADWPEKQPMKTEEKIKFINDILLMLMKRLRRNLQVC